MDDLYHWGIKGMKWGVRRYQDENGRLTEAGLRRYRDSKNVRKDRLKPSDLHPEDAKKVMQYLNEEVEWNRKLSELYKEPVEGFGKRLVKKLIEGKVDSWVRGMGSDSSAAKKKKRDEELEFEKEKARVKKWGEAVGKAEGEKYAKDKYRTEQGGQTKQGGQTDKREKKSEPTINVNFNTKSNTGGGSRGIVWRVAKKKKNYHNDLPRLNP